MINKIEKDDNSIIWWSNCFHTVNTHYTRSLSEVKDLYTKWLEENDHLPDNQKRTVDSKETKNYGASKSDLGNISDYDDFLNGLKVIFTDVFDVLIYKTNLHYW